MKATAPVSLVSVKVAAERLDRRPEYVIDLVHAGELLAIDNGKRGTGRRYRIVAASLDRYLEASRVVVSP